MVNQGAERLKSFLNNRWLVFVVSIWIQCCAGVGYMFGSISPVIKSGMGYNQRQIALLGVAKDLGDSIGFIAGALSEILPFWAILTVGVLQNVFGYGLVWLIVTNRLPHLPLWVLCIAMFVGTNGETYYNTAALVACVQNFPKSRGPIVGILKGFSGLSGAILIQVYNMISPFDGQDSLILMIAVGPALVVLSLMFLVRSVDGHRQVRPSDGLSFTFIYSVCLMVASYLLVILLLEDETNYFKESSVIVCSVVLFAILLTPVILPVILAFSPPPPPSLEQQLFLGPESSKSKRNEPEILLSELDSEAESEDERMRQNGIETVSDRKKRIAHLQAKLFQAAAEGAVRVRGRSRRGPRRGENFTLGQALVKADFWLIFVSLVIAAGSGVTVIDNMGQMSQSMGYEAGIFVSMISIWNFLGRVGGGYFSEVVVRNYAYPRPVAMAVFQAIMALGLLYYALGWPGAIYVVTFLTGIGYGSHWAIVPAAVSELFGLKSFGALYNFLTIAMPIGSLLFSGVIASSIYEHYAEEQAGLRHPVRGDDGNSPTVCTGIVCYSVTCGILSGLLLVAIALSLLVVHRTRGVYAQLYARRQT